MTSEPPTSGADVPMDAVGDGRELVGRCSGWQRLSCEPWRIDRLREVSLLTSWPYAPAENKQVPALVPPTFLVAQRIDAAALGVPEAPARLNGSNFCRWEAEVHPGDELERCTEIVDVSIRRGGTGLLMFYRLSSVYRRFENHAIVARSTSTTIRRYPRADGEGPATKHSTSFDAPASGLVDAQVVLEVTPTSRDLVRYAAATDDYYEAHYDYAFARGAGLPGVITHGLLKFAYFATAAARLGGPGAVVRELSASYRGTDLVAEPFRVLARHVESQPPTRADEQSWDLYGLSFSGVVTTQGHALLSASQ